jgi:hypothetical protein
MKSQLSGLTLPKIVGFVKSATDLTHFETLKAYLEDGTDAYTFAEGNPNDIQKYISLIQNAPGGTYLSIFSK